MFVLECPWYLGSMDYFTPIKVGWIRPGYVDEFTQLTITSYDHFHEHPSRVQMGPRGVQGEGVMVMVATQIYFMFAPTNWGRFPI